VEAVERDTLVERSVSRVGNYDLDLYRLPGATGTIELEAHAMNILNSFFIREYRFDRSGVVVDAKDGDIVIDGGGCWGDTALYFADRAPKGKVFVFEFDPRNLEVLRRNLARNPRLAERIEIVEKALWSKSGEELPFADAGPATRIGSGSIAVESISIDDFAAQANAPRVDFIKLDVEGAEIPVLHGAQNTIRSFAPKLAVSIYHSIHDLLTIPQLLDQMRTDYDVYVDHATIHAEETIAFAARR
jgi:FkbM family methyltransferase